MKPNVRMNPLISASITIAQLINSSDNVVPISDELMDEISRLQDNNAKELEIILQSQAIVLNIAFSTFLCKFNQLAGQSKVLLEHPEAVEMFARLALKCQDQSRKTILALNEVRNPKKPTQFIKNYVNQQLNQLQVEQQELKKQMEEGNAALEFGSAQEAATVDVKNQTVGEKHRAKISRREVESIT